MAASAASLTAQPAERSGRGERPDRAAQRKQILDRFDKNKDGELDEEEREAASSLSDLNQRHFQRWLS